MIELFLYHHQRDVLPELQTLFPDLEAETWREAGVCYRASFTQGQIMRQIQFLHDHGIRYIDHHHRCEKRVRAFFQGVQVEGLPIREISVRPATRPNAHAVILKTAATQVWLFLPPEWLRLDAQLDAPCARWLCVYASDGRVYAARASSDERQRPPEHATETMEQMQQWLSEQGYVLALRVPALCGMAELYRPWDEVTGGKS